MALRIIFPSLITISIYCWTSLIYDPIWLHMDMRIWLLQPGILVFCVDYSAVIFLLLYYTTNAFWHFGIFLSVDSRVCCLQQIVSMPYWFVYIYIYIPFHLLSKFWGPIFCQNERFPLRNPVNSSVTKGINSLEDGARIDCYDFLAIFLVSSALGQKEGKIRISLRKQLDKLDSQNLEGISVDKQGK